MDIMYVLDFLGTVGMIQNAVRHETESQKATLSQTHRPDSRLMTLGGFICIYTPSF